MSNGGNDGNEDAMMNTTLRDAETHREDQLYLALFSLTAQRMFKS
jgi:hypothetical protein